MNNLIKQIVESKYNFNIDIDNDYSSSLLKQNHNSMSQKDEYDNAFKQKNLALLNKNQRIILYDNFEQYRRYQYKVHDRAELQDIIHNAVEFEDLNYLDVTNVHDMDSMFEYTRFKGNISKWDMSNVTSMSRMFYNCRFNGDISEWDVSNVEDMRHMFMNSSFCQDLSNWKIKRGSNCGLMFWGTKTTSYNKYMPQFV